MDWCLYDRDLRHERVNKTVWNTLSDIISHKLIVCYDKDRPWFNTKIKLLIQEKSKTYKVLHKNIGNNYQIEKLKFLQNV